ncbi:MAG: tRNA (adenosine(37)-N6)-threonylcarbamoyltransferase complex ATPase subunit type 1 TsaE [Propionibacterium sp.]|nr:tRNA (adenosine(37)-N6)-threonylcarbamoyltransferase complex ATPase subunit type 1 TsaE [Propionibacterium sp.]
MIATTLIAATDLGARRVEIVARREFPRTVTWWERAGFTKLAEIPHGWVMGRPLPVAVAVPDAEAMRALGRRLAGLLRAGDVVVATGELGAGKTTLSQGIGAGLDVEGPIISPTFVISRVHRARAAGPDFVHVDGYRLGSAGELDDIDLQETLPTSVTLVEWGRGLAEGLSPDRLEVEIHRSLDPDDDERTVYLFGIGERWIGVLEALRSHP